MKINKMFLHLLMALLVSLVAACTPTSAAASPAMIVEVQAASTTCANEGYAYTKLQWCKAICESSLSQAQKDVYIRRWMDRYRDLPYCLLGS